MVCSVCGRESPSDAALTFPRVVHAVAAGIRPTALRATSIGTRAAPSYARWIAALRSAFSRSSPLGILNAAITPSKSATTS